MRARPPLVLTLAGFMAAACMAAPPATPSALAPTPSPASSSPPSTSRPTTSPTTAPSPSPSPAPAATPSPVPAPSISLLHDGPIIRAGDLEETRTAVLPAAYFFAEDIHHAYLVGFGAFPGDQDVHYATSQEGLSWSVEVDDPFADLGLTMSPPGPIPGSVLQIDGEWVMYLWGVPSPQYDGAQLYRATAPGPGGPWTADPEPVVPVGDTGEVDDGGLDFPTLLPIDDGYLMLYGANGGDRPHAARILLARSDDGLEWEKLGRVLEPQECGGPVSSYVAIPRAFPHGDGFATLAVLGDDIVLATSDDGLDWSCPFPEPIFLATDVPDNDRVHTIAATQVDGETYVMIEALVGDGSEIWLGRLEGF